MQLVDIVDFDSIQFALNPRIGDNLVDRQNELRCICGYVVWRKDSSKSASYFILHFFHGYERREIAAIASLPIAAIHNKLKVARHEVKSHLEASGKLRIATREAPPGLEPLLSPKASSELFDDLQQMIFEAKDTECLSEDALLEFYQSTSPKPIPCGLLSHIVSCRHCLDVIDRHFQRPSWEDREPPHSVWSSLDRKDERSIDQKAKGYKELRGAVEWQRSRVHDHRPRMLSIAVNGKIVAFHDVRSERSTLTARVEHPEAAQFIEVFTLSDDRWLELVLSYDGQGLHSEVTYFDPVLAAQGVEEEGDEELAAPQKTALLAAPNFTTNAETTFERITRKLSGLTPRSALGWATVLAVVLGTATYLAYRHYNSTPLDAKAVLRQSIEIETASLKGETEHQILRLDTTDADGHSTWQGTVDIWKEHDTGRTMRRLYDARDQLVAEAWQGKKGQRGSSVEASRDLSAADREIASRNLWQQDVSASAFEDLTGRRDADSHRRRELRVG